MGYGDEARRRKALTPLESELRFGTASRPPRRGWIRRAFGWYRSLPPPTSTVGATVRGLPSFLFVFAVGVAAALAVAQWLDEPDAVAFYLVGAGAMAVGAGANGRGSWILAGALVIGVGVLLELT